MPKRLKESEKFIVDAVRIRFDLLAKCKEALELIYDEADHGLYSEAADMEEVMTRNLQVIRGLAGRRIKEIQKLSEEGR